MIIAARLIASGVAVGVGATALPGSRLLAACCGLVALAGIATSPATASGQSGAAVLTGTVSDSSGDAVRRAQVCYMWEGVRYCTEIDSLGTYRVPDVPAGEHSVTVTCNIPRTWFYHVLGERTIVFRDSVVTEQHWNVGTTGCDRRVLRRLSGVFTGHLTSGFEQSSLRPCPADAWFIPTDSLHLYGYDAADAWVEFAPGVHQRITWPDNPERVGDSMRYYVRLRGTLTGPGPSGHLGMAQFALTVDSVLELRRPGPDDCRGRGGEQRPADPASRDADPAVVMVIVLPVQ